MGRKLYVDGLRVAAFGAHKYATRYQAQLAANLTSDQYAALIDFITCVANLLAKLGKNIVVP